MNNEEIIKDINAIQNDLQIANDSLKKYEDYDELTEEDIHSIEKMSDNIGILIEKLENLLNQL